MVRDCLDQSVATSFHALGQLEPLAFQFFILTFDLGIANAAGQLPAFGRVGAKLLRSRLLVHSSLP